MTVHAQLLSLKNPCTEIDVRIDNSKISRGTMKLDKDGKEVTKIFHFTMQNVGFHKAKFKIPMECRGGFGIERTRVKLWGKIVMNP